VTDDESFESFMAAALPALLRFGHVLTGDPHRAEELVQAALVKTYQRWARVDRATPQAYVRSAMVNTHTSWWRRGRREGSLPPGFDVASAASAVRDYDDRDLALRALQTLPPVPAWRTACAVRRCAGVAVRRCSRWPRLRSS
jgi:DNA-directed RNA polymerase specialized sigma24 family protein